MPLSSELYKPHPEQCNQERVAGRIATQIVEILDDYSINHKLAIATLLSSELLDLHFTENESEIFAHYLATDDVEALLPISEKAIEHILPDGIDNYPLSKERMLSNFSSSGLRPVAHFANSLLDELDASGDKSEAAIAKIVVLQLACAELLHNKTNGDNLDTLTHVELEQNQENLAALSRIADREGVALNAEDLMRIQPAIFEMLTSNHPITTEDVNYRKRLNSMPNAARSLQAPDLPDSNKLLSRYGDYIDFIEATAATKRGGYASTFGFLHRVGADEAGNPFIIEYPHTMFDKEILNIDHPVMEKLMSFEQNFQRTHDMLHNALPVYADHFMIHHPSAPITLGGYLPDYVEFGKGMRKDKSSYELALAILHKQIMQDRFMQDPGLLAEHVVAVVEILDGLADMQARSLCSDKAIDHVSFVVMSAAMNILSYDERAAQDLLDKYDRLTLPSTIVRPADVYKLLVQQEIVVVDEALSADVPSGISADQRISQICGQINDEIAIDGLRDPNIDYDSGEQGAEYIVNALREMGIEPVGLNEQFILSGRDRLRWTGITASSRRLKGFNEKIHGLQTVRYWDGVANDFIDVKPVELLGKFYDHFQQHAEEYDSRVWFRGLSNATLRQFKDIVFDPSPEFSELALQKFPAAFSTIDHCISSLIDDTYMPLDEVSLANLKELCGHLRDIGFEDASHKIDTSLQAYEVLVNEAQQIAARSGQNFTDARRALELQLMSLDG
jgi:hypothetical protein